ncbi:MAG: signal peptidase II [Ferrimicrobium sp.]|jgi:signal peptidase II|uniref:Lipoprotein signal peptidase n=1 Tax=Ferrimicrobium acidiphilum TaxID=121039 RepID=A0ABV3Y2R6_9ACTN|nr:signal peptidase II [Ferrimicrobium sp.]
MKGFWSRAVTVFVVVALVVLLDQVTKTWAENALRRGPIDVLGPIKLELTFNSGFSFSLGRGHPLVITAAAVVIAIGVGAFALFTPSRLKRIAAALVVGGALGNLADRIFRHNHGAVIDFIRLPHWPVFNLADSAITVGVVLLVVAGVIDGRREPSQH